MVAIPTAQDLMQVRLDAAKQPQPVLSDACYSQPSVEMTQDEIQVRQENCRLVAIIEELGAQLAALDPLYGEQCDDGPIAEPVVKTFPARALQFAAMRIGLFVPRT